MPNFYEYFSMTFRFKTTAEFSPATNGILQTREVRCRMSQQGCLTRKGPVVLLYAWLPVSLRRWQLRVDVTYYRKPCLHPPPSPNAGYWILIDSYPDLNLFGFVVRGNLIFMIACKGSETDFPCMVCFMGQAYIFIESFNSVRKYR
jgi:hypothetical protein